MTHTEIIILNFEEIRRRSVKLWTALPPEHFFWKPDSNAMHCLEMIRHVLEGEHLFHKIIEARGNLGSYESPWTHRNYSDVYDELNFSIAYRAHFFETIRGFTAHDLDAIEIIRTEKNQRRKLGDYLQRIAYHEAVHAGQMLSYFRTMQIAIPNIWD
jgi:uncharacterized damage-inducible protein DinB